MGIVENKKAFAGIIVFVSLVLVTAFQVTDIFSVSDQSDFDDGSDAWKEDVEGVEPEVATLAGGCFWCTEAIYLDREGVGRAVSGFAEGSEETANYDRVVSGGTDHREAVRLEYYPSFISYDEILDIYWRSIDPTDDGGQFTDRGYHYTTAIYFHNEDQKRVAESSKENISENFEEPVATEVKNYTTFFRAGERHQNYSKRNSFRYEAYKQGSGRESTLDRLWGDHPFQ